MDANVDPVSDAEDMPKPGEEGGDSAVPAGALTVTRPVLVYDGDCRFCRFAARAIDRLDRENRIAFLPFADPEAAPLLADLPEGDRTGSIHLVDPDGRRFSRGAALTRLIGHLGARPGAGHAPAAAQLLGRAYDPIARNRSRLGRRVPDGEAPRRYP